MFVDETTAFVGKDLSNQKALVKTAMGMRDFEPAGALFAGQDGLDAYRVLVPQLPRLLTEYGTAVLEIGAAQADAVTAIMAAVGFRRVALRDDYGGRARCLVFRRAG